MSAARLRVLSAQQTAALLSRALGNLRNWSDFLSDCARQRGNTNYHGLTLEPVAYTRDRCERPAYHTARIEEFIRRARELAPRPPVSDDFRPFTVEIDSRYLDLPLRMRRAVRIEEPIPS